MSSQTGVCFEPALADYLETLNESDTEQGVWDKTARYMASLGIEHAGLIFGVGSETPTNLSTLPERFFEQYLEQVYSKGLDHVVEHCKRYSSPFVSGTAFFGVHPAAVAHMNFERDLRREMSFTAILHVPVRDRAAPGWGMFTVCTALDRSAFTARVNTILSNMYFLSAASLARVRAVRQSQTAPGVANLSPRERECLLWLSKGERYDRIAYRLSLQKRTVVFHIDNARRKLDARTNEQALAIAILNRLIEP